METEQMFYGEAVKRIVAATNEICKVCDIMGLERTGSGQMILSSGGWKSSEETMPYSEIIPGWMDTVLEPLKVKYADELIESGDMFAATMNGATNDDA